MRWQQFFLRFGDMRVWKVGYIGREGWTVEELYQAFARRLSAELFGESANDLVEKARFGRENADSSEP